MHLKGRRWTDFQHVAMRVLVTEGYATNNDENELPQSRGDEFATTII